MKLIKHVALVSILSSIAFNTYARELSINEKAIYNDTTALKKFKTASSIGVVVSISGNMAIDTYDTLPAVEVLTSGNIHVKSMNGITCWREWQMCDLTHVTPRN